MTHSAHEALAAATRRLMEAGVPDAARDARRLLSHAAGVDPGRLTLMLGEPLADVAKEQFNALVERRAARQPVSQIVGSRAFYGREFAVTGDVLDPRPETEILIEAALTEPFGHVLDLGVGSGCILLTLLAEMPDARGVGVDISPAAVEVARRNAHALELPGRAHILVSDWTASVEGVFDLIVSNPPYISREVHGELAPEVRDHEPALALTDGADGLMCYRAIFSSAGPFLTEDGRLIVEIGPDQAEDVQAIASVRGFETVAVVPDLDGRDRVVVTQFARDGG